MDAPTAGDGSSCMGLLYSGLLYGSLLYSGLLYGGLLTSRAALRAPRLECTDHTAGRQCFVTCVSYAGTCPQCRTPARDGTMTPNMLAKRFVQPTQRSAVVALLFT